jgi:hypothetical protein
MAGASFWTLHQVRWVRHRFPLRFPSLFSIGTGPGLPQRDPVPPGGACIPHAGRILHAPRTLVIPASFGERGRFSGRTVPGIIGREVGRKSTRSEEQPMKVRIEYCGE